MNKNRPPLIWFIIILFSGFILSCKKESNQSKPDFRDNLIGSYKCIETSYIFAPIDDTIMNWNTDTISSDIEIIVEKWQDSSLKLTISDYPFIGTFDENERFTCLDCTGPPDHAQFHENDSLYIYRKYGVTNSRNYYGKKQY